MKKAFFIIPALAGCLMASAQKKNNGSIFIEHPAITVVNDFEKAIATGDSAKIASYLTEDFKGYNGTTTNINEPAVNKKAYINNLLTYKKFLDYFTIKPLPGSYPDALEYAKDNKNNETVVQDWIMIDGVEKHTGVQIDAAAHNIYNVTKENKIRQIIGYSNDVVINEIRASYSGNRTNGKIYNHHENINTIRRTMYAFGKSDLDKCMSAYRDDAKFSNTDFNFDSSHSKTQETAGRQNFLTNFEIKSIDIVGYPDYLEYEMGNGRSVLSWWKLNLVRKKDKKAIVLPMHLNDDFDENGKIVSEAAYYNAALLEK